MTFRPTFLRSFALGASALNLVGVGLAAGGAEPWHAGLHATAALLFWAWAQRLRQAPDEARLSRDEALELEIAELRRELSEAQERLDFTERMLSQGLETRRHGPER